ncbi:MAG: GH116 family glycosyl-hydrolase [Kiritimatiellia bacterium]
MRSIAFMAAALALSAAAAPQEPADRNLVPNAGFELGAVGWHVRTTRQRTDPWTCAAVSFPAEGAWRGRSLRVDVPERSSVRIASECLRLEPGVTYFVSARVKAATPGRTSLVLASPMLNRWWSAGTKGTEVSNAWQRLSGAITVAEGHHEALLTVEWKQPGAFWVDEVQVCRAANAGFAPRDRFEAGFDLDDTYGSPGPRRLRFRAFRCDGDGARDIVLRAEHPATGWRQTRTMRMSLVRGVAAEQEVEFDCSHCGELLLSSDVPGDVPVRFAVLPTIAGPLPKLGDEFSVGVNETGVFPPIGSWEQCYQGAGRSFAEHLALLRACGVQHVRAFGEDYLQLPVFNPDRGVYDDSRLQPWLDAMEASGLPFYLVLGFDLHRRKDYAGWNHWSAARKKAWYLFRESRPTGRDSPTWPDQCIECLPDVADVAAVCGELAKRCRGRVAWYELFNEPNLSLCDPQDCVRYQQAVCAAMKRADPACRLAGVCTTQDFGVTGAADFAGGCFRNGIAPYLDALSFHPYSAALDNGLQPAAPFLRALGELVRPYPHVALWNTECFYLLNRRDVSVWRKRDPMFLRPQNLVRRALIDLTEGVRVSSSIHVMQLFRPHFAELTQHTGEHSGYRLTPTDAAVGLAAFARLMTRATPVRSLATSLPDGLCGSLFRLADGRPAAVLWAYEDRRKFVVRTEGVAYDMYGNRCGPEVLIDERPVYLVGTGDPEPFFRSLAFRHEQPVVENGRRRLDADTVAVEILDLVAKTARTEFRRPVAGDPERFGKTLRSGERAQVGPLGFSVSLAEEGVVVEAHTVDTNRFVGTWQQPWTGDTIELFFDANPHSGFDRTRDAPGTFRLFVLPPTPDPADAPGHRARGLATNTRKLDVRGIAQRIDADEQGFGCRLTIPWSYFGGKRLDAIGFDIIADDFDPVTRRRTAAHVWSGDDANYESRFKWGRVLADRQPGAGAKAADWPVLKTYAGAALRQVKLPLGGIGTGTVSLSGRGGLVDWEVQNRPAKGYTPRSSPWAPSFNPSFVLRTETADGRQSARLLEGPLYPDEYEGDMGCRAPNQGFPRFAKTVFKAAYPLGIVEFDDPKVPLAVKLEAMNPLIPGDADASGIPAVLLRWRLRNPTDRAVRASIAATVVNFAGISPGRNPRAGLADLRELVCRTNGLAGVVLAGKNRQSAVHPSDGECAIFAPEAAGSVTVAADLREPGWGVAMDRAWSRLVARGDVGDTAQDDTTATQPTHLAQLCVAVGLNPGEEKEVPFVLAWRFPNRMKWHWDEANPRPEDCVGNWYATRYPTAASAAVRLWSALPALEAGTVAFVKAVLARAAPDVVKEAALFNLSTLRTETCFRTPDGHFFGWEGCADRFGSCFGNCSHVWGYEHCLVDLWPDLARSMLDNAFGPQLKPNGHMRFRVLLPLAANTNDLGVACADGQMQTIVKAYEYWRKSGDDGWLRRTGPAIRRALAFAWIDGGWDADRDGVMEGCQHNTMDVEYYGPNPQMEFLYLAALKASAAMADACGETAFAADCRALAAQGSAWTERNLFNGSYYEHRIVPPQGKVADGLRHRSMGAKDLADPDFQLGAGCLVDQLVGDYASRAVGLGPVADEDHARTTLRTILGQCRRAPDDESFNPMRSYALAGETSLRMAWYPPGRFPRSPFPYYRETMTGFEYVVAANLAQRGQFAAAERVVRDIRDRYDGRKRNPFDEAECGHHYARALDAWSVLQAWRK